MIGNFEQIFEDIGFNPNCIRVTDISGIKHIFLIKTDFSFSSFSDFDDPDVWRQGIKDGDIFPIFSNKQTDDQTEDVKTNLNNQGFIVKTSSGKYRFLLHYNFTYDYAKTLKTFSETNLDLMFVDLNNNLYGYTPDSIEVQGFETDLILFDKTRITSGREPSYTLVSIELSEASQLDTEAKIIKPSFSVLRKLDLTPVDVINIEQGSVKFKVIDQNYGNPVITLRSGDIIVNDNSGPLTYSTFINLGGGEYLLDDLSGALTYGDIEVDTDYYYGSGNYTFGNAPVTIENFVFNALDDIEFDVRLDSDNSLVTGLLVGDFAITDDTHGAISIGAFAETSTGHYQLSSLSNDLTTGDVDITGMYLGTYAYDSNVTVEVYNFSGITTSIIECSVRESISLNAVSGLVKADFEVDDNLSGIITINNVTEDSPGDYTLYLAIARTDGDVNISTIIYTGTGAYDYTGPTVYNAGYTAGGATDWVDSDSDGKADGVNAGGTQGKTFSIISQIGFSGVGQRVDMDNTVLSAGITINANYFKPGSDYYATVKYRADKNFKMSVLSNTGAVDEEITGAGDWITRTITTANFTVDADDKTIIISLGITETISTTAAFEIDELFLIEIP